MIDAFSVTVVGSNIEINLYGQHIFLVSLLQTLGDAVRFNLYSSASPLQSFNEMHCPRSPVERMRQRSENAFLVVYLNGRRNLPLNSPNTKCSINGTIKKKNLLIVRQIRNIN